VHAAPADLSFGREALATRLGDVARLPECLGDFPRIALWILGPLGRARGGIDPDDTAPANADLAQRLPDLTGLSHLRDELAPLGGTIAGRRRSAAGNSSSVESMLTCAAQKQITPP
jgi:hypothetical protein